MVKINIGIIADGPTDHLILGKIAQCIMLSEPSQDTMFNFIYLRKNIHDFVKKYYNSSNGNECYLPSSTAIKLRDQIFGVLNTAFKEFKDEEEITSNDIILLTTDTEQILNTPNQYFERGDAITQILLSAIEKFYHIQIQTTESEYYQTRLFLPKIIPLATFPSTEVLVAATQDLLTKHYGKKPSELKQLLYGTKEVLSEEELDKKALQSINYQTVDKIFSQVPESRLFFQLLSPGFKPCIFEDCETLRDLHQQLSSSDH